MYKLFNFSLRIMKILIKNDLWLGGDSWQDLKDLFNPWVSFTPLMVLFTQDNLSWESLVSATCSVELLGHKYDMHFVFVIVGF
jgi:hypothetical protein